MFVVTFGKVYNVFWTWSFSIVWVFHICIQFLGGDGSWYISVVNFIEVEWIFKVISSYSKIVALISIFLLLSTSIPGSLGFVIRVSMFL